MQHTDVHKHTCLNCDATLAGAYCHQCGQKADTHRITVPHLIQHDLVHGLWHFDKGLLFTLREALLRPGTMALNYINGKRIKYYNVFYLVLLVLGLNVLTAHYFRQFYHIAEVDKTKGLVIQGNMVDLSYYIKHHLKLLLFLIIPFFAIGGFISFRRLRLNFAEHIVLAGSLLLSGAMWYFFVEVGIYSSIGIQSYWFNAIVWLFAVAVILQPAMVYYPACRGTYSIGAFVLRLLQWYGTVAFLLFFVLLAFAAVTGKTHFKLG